MIAQIQKQFTRLTLAQHKFLARLESWPAAKLQARENGQGWCALQVADHLIRTESSILDLILVPVEAAPRSPSAGNRFTTLMVLLTLSSTRRVRVPKQATGVLPGHNQTLDGIHLAWEQEQNRYLEWCQSLRPTCANRPVFRHPIGGWMSPATTLRFLSIHIRHHLFQLDRIERFAVPSSII